MKYRFLEDVATADIAFEAYGKTLAELFQNCAQALMAVMADPKAINPITNYQLRITSKTIEELLFDFLNELVFLKDKENAIFCKFDLIIHDDTSSYHRKRRDQKYKLEAKMGGETIDPKRHRLRADIKAATWHLFKIEKKEKNYRARVVVDI